jgi:excisionase family DNA binding protein
VRRLVKRLQADHLRNPCFCSVYLANVLCAKSFADRQVAKIVLMNEEFLTVTEASIALGMSSPDFLYRLLRNRVVKGTKIGGRWYVSRDQVDLRRARVQTKKSSVSYVDRDSKRAVVRERFAPMGRQS